LEPVPAFPTLPPVSDVADLIRAEIRRHGAIPFARFMELALYAPGAGYYERPGHAPGRDGDFFTSVGVGPLFGRLLAWRFARWLPAEGPVQVVEAGAHDGRLAGDVLDALARHEPALRERLMYVIIEPSPARRGWQQAALAAHAGRVRWAADPAELGPGGVRGVVFANELLDAFPVRRLGWDAAAGAWREWGVAEAEGRFAWRLGGPAGDAPPPPAEVAALLPDGFVREWSPAAEAWWARAAGALGEGRLLTFDYGADEAELLLPGREAGTLRAYRRHRRVDDVLARPGAQDLTAHVDFTRVRAAGEAAGLATEEYAAQGRVLTAVLAGLLREGGGWAADLTREARALQTLTHPGQLGAAFRVLVQRRDAG
jgi:SAM-dependent MidA family methyltransferase